MPKPKAKAKKEEAEYVPLTGNALAIAKEMEQAARPATSFRIRKMKPYTPAWERLANQIAREHVEVRACKTCGHPCHHSYQCTFCGETDP